VKVYLNSLEACRKYCGLTSGDRAGRLDGYRPTVQSTTIRPAAYMSVQYPCSLLDDSTEACDVKYALR